MELVRSKSLPLRLRPIAQVIVFRSRSISWLPVHQVLARSLLIDARVAVVPTSLCLKRQRLVGKYIDIMAARLDG